MVTVQMIYGGGRKSARFVVTFRCVFSCVCSLVLCSVLPSVESWITQNPETPHRCSPWLSTSTWRRGADITALSAKKITGIASAGISVEELGRVRQAIVMACQDQDVTASLDAMMTIDNAIPTRVLGATGRAILLRASDDLSEEDLFDLQCAISQELDELIYSNPPLLSQPVLLSIQSESDIPDHLSQDAIVEQLASRIENEVQQYEMNVPLPSRNPTYSSFQQTYIPSHNIKVDGAHVVGPDGNTFWDTSSLLVFDNLVTNDLRRKLLDVVLGREADSEPTWDDTNLGPDPCRWERGGLLDIPEEEEIENQSAEVKEDGPCWGLREEAISELCFEHHDALQEFETILSDLLPQFAVTRLPEAVLGAGVSPLTANAATFGDRFDWHIDADPKLTPPSPWTDVYGRYPNRCKGKPRFVSCLLYLSDEWKPADWGAPTRFLDVATDMHHEVQAKSGRVVIMDQDITHCVVAPLEVAGERPRYSLVWKLVLHPKKAGQDMTDLCGKLRSEWPEPLLLGSAAVEPKDETAKVRLC